MTAHDIRIVERAPSDAALPWGCNAVRDEAWFKDMLQARAAAKHPGHLQAIAPTPARSANEAPVIIKVRYPRCISSEDPLLSSEKRRTFSLAAADADAAVDAAVALFSPLSTDVRHSASDNNHMMHSMGAVCVCVLSDCHRCAYSAMDDSTAWRHGGALNRLTASPCHH